MYLSQDLDGAPFSSLAAIAPDKMNVENNKDRRPRVFLVDDHECMLRTVERIFGHECSIVGNAPNGALAVDAVLELQPDIVIMDVMMPEMNGIEACLCLRQRGFKAKILFISSGHDPDIREAAMKSGGDGFLSKLRLASELRQTVFVLLKGQPRAQPDLDESSCSH